jgi:2-dehydropantoate 2-reductase
MKILMFGRGVIATVYAWALEKAGHHVDFYVRPGRAREYGPVVDLHLLDARHKLRKGVAVRETFPIRMREELPPDHDYDLIILSVQHWRFAEAAAFLATRCSRATVLVFNNFFTDPQPAAAALPAAQLVWGFPGAGGGFQPDGSLHASLLHLVQFGTFGDEPTARDLAVREVFRGAGFKLREHRDFRSWLWIHFVTNAGMLAEALAAGSLGAVFRSTTHLKAAILTARELLPLVTARGGDLGQHRAETALFRLPPWLGSRAIKAVMQLSDPARLVVDSHTNPEELRSTCRDVLAEARRLGIAVPRLAAREPYFA